MFLIVYLVINFVIMSANISGLISDTYSIFYYFILGVTLLSINIKRTENFKKKAGTVLIEVNTNFPNTKWIWAIIIALTALSGQILLLAQTKMSQAQFPVISVFIYQIVYILYLQFFTKTTFNENGLLIDGLYLKWDNISSYEWSNKRFQIRGNVFDLLIKSKTKLSLGEYHINIDYSQRTDIDKLLVKKVVITRSANDT